jgi:hypothetical protein
MFVKYFSRPDIVLKSSWFNHKGSHGYNLSINCQGHLVWARLKSPTWAVKYPGRAGFIIIVGPDILKGVKVRVPPPPVVGPGRPCLNVGIVKKKINGLRARGKRCADSFRLVALRDAMSHL